MTIFAGAYSLDASRPLPETLCRALRQHVSRQPDDVPAEFHGKGFFAVHVDIGAFGAPAVLQDASANLTLVAGEPLLTAGEDDPAWNRSRDTAAIHAMLLAQQRDALAGSRGTFCGVHYNAQRHALSVFVDKVGVRPVYLWVGPHFAVFATAMRILEAVAEVPKELDLRGVSEIAAFQFPLADRTAYLGIRALLAAEIVSFEQGRATPHQYWRWDTPEDPPLPHAQMVERAYAAFIAALKRRQRNQPLAAAFLSGGLDSRVIAGGLRAIGTEVHTVNFAPDHTQDQVFATMASGILSTHHTQLHTDSSTVHQGYRKPQVVKWLRTNFTALAPDRQPKRIWAGDGGSVGLGHVYMEPEIVAAMQRGDVDQAIAIFNRYVPLRVLRPSVRKTVASIPAQGVREELANFRSSDPGRVFHLFLMANDQRRHLAQHFEDIDRDRIEFELPFFDADFLDTVLRSPVEPYLAHRFYMDWLACFPNQLDSVPWQAYPGHVPCLLPIAGTLRYQWREYYDKKIMRRMRRDIAEQGSNLLAVGTFPQHLISRSSLNGAIWLTRLGVRNYEYLIRTALTYHRYWARCDVAGAGAAGRSA